MNTVIYGFGIAGKWAVSHFDEVVAFVDTDMKKSGDDFLGISVEGPSYLDTLDYSETQVVVSVVDIMDVVPILEKKGVKNWVPLSSFIDLESPLVNGTGESDSFLSYSLQTVKACQEAYLSADALFIRSVDLVITEKCTLKCKDCANLMQFFVSPKNIDHDLIMAGILALAKSCRSINEVRLIGGEPFVNKEIYKIIERLLEIENISSIVIYTNGMVPLKREYLPLLKNSKIQFSVTDYADIGVDISATKTFLEEMDISHRVHPPEHWTDSGRIEDFRRTPEELEALFAKCCGKNLFTLVEDRLYRCPFAANADSLGAVPEDDRNSVSVNGTKTELRRYLSETKFLPACNYCVGRSFDAPEIIPAVQVRTPLHSDRRSETITENG